MFAVKSMSGKIMIEETTGFAAVMKAIYAVLTSIGMTASAFGIAAAAASVVVMCITQPRSGSEWAAALIVTVAGSIGGGSLAIVKLGLLQNAKTFVDAASLGGVVFACGLPSWLVARIVFSYLEKRRSEGASPIDIIKEVKNAI